MLIVPNGFVTKKFHLILGMENKYTYVLPIYTM